jgi:Domain of unknown function (DUF4055)
MPNVTFKRPELKKLFPIYELISDVIEGETAVKAKREKYLPKPNADDISKENKARYDAYLARAVFYNVARRTLNGLVGQVFMRDPKVEIPQGLEALKADATGTGINLIQLAKQAIGNNLAFSRSGIFVDYPAVEEKGGASIEDLKTEKIRPTMFVYSPMEIINWRTMERGAKEVISLVVLLESYEIADDGFEIKKAAQFRVLKLDGNGDYVQDIWREAVPTELKNDSLKITNGNFSIEQTFYPKDFNGNSLKEIPFMFIGSENNDPKPDNPNFYDLASLNLAHYRNSADYEESCYMVGQPTLVMTGLTEDWVTDILKGSATMGSRGGLPLPVGADAKLIQAQANTMIKENMDAKERQMVALGAKLVEQKEVQRTAKEAGLEAASEGSTLANVTKNVSAAFVFALNAAMQFISADKSKIVFELNTDFDISAATPEQRAQIILEWQAGAITFNEMRAVLRKAGSATEEDEKAKATIETDTAKAMAMEAVINAPPESAA